MCFGLRRSDMELVQSSPLGGLVLTLSHALKGNRAYCGTAFCWSGLLEYARSDTRDTTRHGRG